MIRKVLVYTYGNRSHDATITAAASFAARHGAELTGLFVKPDFMGYSSVYGEYPLNLSKAFSDLQADYSKKAHKQFDKIIATYGCRSQWREVEQYARKPRPSLYTDFIFISQPTTESSVVFNDTDFVDHLITQTNLPTIIVPAGWSTRTLGDYPLLGWKETREAGSTVRHGLPLLREAKNVNILTVTKRPEQDEDSMEGIEISEYLSAHDVNCKFFSERMLESDQDESVTLLRHAKNYDRDLILIGGYGHSRFREIVLGGMTRSLIKTSTLPLLVSH